MNFASVLKAEISRVARKELRPRTAALNRASTKYRRDIASLEKRVSELEQLLKLLSRIPAKSMVPAEPSKDDASVQRFNAKDMAAQRKRLALSAAEMGLILGVSAQSVYHWEKGKSRPRASQMPAISAMRKMGKRDVAYRLSVIQG